MKIGRRAFLSGAVGAPVLAGTGQGAASPALPAAADFITDGAFLNSAFTHPIPAPVSAAMEEYVRVRRTQPKRLWVTQDVENDAAALFARLVNVAPGDVAAVPSTMVGENLIAQALNLGPAAGVVTDAFHYFASLALYGEMRKQGVTVSVVAPRDNRISLEDLAAAIKPGTRLVALSLVSSHTGYVHDLKAVCDLAHSRGALVYADIIQAVGAMPVDLTASGVDFACCGGYKWLQGDFGAAFLYVRPQSRGALRRVQTGWRQVEDYQSHAFPLDPPGPVEGSWRIAAPRAEGLFEVSSPSHAALWALRASIDYVTKIGVDTICQYRRPLMTRLYAGMAERSYKALTPPEQNSPVATFSRAGLGDALRQRLRARNVTVSVGPNFVRISPSIFNTAADIDLFLEAARLS